MQQKIQVKKFRSTLRKKKVTLYIYIYLIRDDKIYIDYQRSIVITIITNWTEMYYFVSKLLESISEFNIVMFWPK